MLLDTTVKRHKIDLLLFAANISPEIRIDSCHAKVLLVENERYKFGIIGSANLNLNHRWEAGYISPPDLISITSPKHLTKPTKTQ